MTGSELPYEIRITGEGRRHLDRLSEKIRLAVLAFAFEALAYRPRRVGKPLTNELAGLWSARRSDYRVVYEIDDDARIVLIHRAAHRRDVYRARWASPAAAPQQTHSPSTLHSAISSTSSMALASWPAADRPRSRRCPASAYRRPSVRR